MSDAHFKITIAFRPFVITRLDRVIHMVKVRLNEISNLLLTLASCAELQMPTCRKNIAWIARSSRAMTERGVGIDWTVRETAAASSLHLLRRAAFGCSRGLRPDDHKNCHKEQANSEILKEAKGPIIKSFHKRRPCLRSGNIQGVLMNDFLASRRLNSDGRRY